MMNSGWSPHRLSFSQSNDTSQIAVDLERAGDGLGIDVKDHEGKWIPAGRVFAIPQFPPTSRLADWYLRGERLYASYEETPAYPLATHLSWQTSPEDLETPAVDRAEWLVAEFLWSTQTSTWDAAPLHEVRSSFDGSAVRAIQPVLADRVSREEDEAPFDAEMAQPFACLIQFPQAVGLLCVHPSDLATPLQIETDAAGGWTVSASLQLNPMEKGVIRRARMMWAVGPPRRESSVIELVHRFRFAASRLSI